jgi:hypothetical protein
MPAQLSHNETGLDAKELSVLVETLGPDEVFGNCNLSELKRFCKHFGLKTAGCKADILASLVDHVQLVGRCAPCSGRNVATPLSNQRSKETVVVRPCGAVVVQDASGIAAVETQHDKHGKRRSSAALKTVKRKRTTEALKSVAAETAAASRAAASSDDRSADGDAEEFREGPLPARNLHEGEACSTMVRQESGRLSDGGFREGPLSEVASLQVSEDEQPGVSSQSEATGVCMIEVEVRLAFSGVLLTRAKLSSDDTVDSLRRIVVNSRAWPEGAQQLFLGTHALKSSSSLLEAGINDGSVVTVACAALRWHETVRGSQVELSSDGLTASRRDNRKFNGAIIITNGPVRMFQFQIIDSSAHFGGGLEIGFSLVPPDDFHDGLPLSAVGLRHAWICDCYGELHAYTGSFHCLDVDYGEQAWDPEMLRAGDVVVCCATERGMMQIDVNGRRVANWEANIPDDVDLYPVVSLFGKTTSVKLLRSDRPEPRTIGNA